LTNRMTIATVSSPIVVNNTLWPQRAINPSISISKCFGWCTVVHD